MLIIFTEILAHGTTRSAKRKNLKAGQSKADGGRCNIISTLDLLQCIQMRLIKAVYFQDC